MKIKYLFSISCLAFLLASCEHDLKETTIYEGENAFYFANEETTVLENVGEVVSVGVVFTTTNGGTGSVDFTTSSEGLVEGVDYNVLNPGTLTFNADNGFTNAVMIELIDNDVFVGGVTPILITLVNPVNGDVGFSGPDNLRSTTLLNVQDDDCSTRNIAGSYNTTVNATSTDACCPDPISVTGSQSIVDNGDNTYTIFDWSAGSYMAFYEQFGVTADYVAAGNLNGVVSVICDEVSGVFGEPFGTETTVTGTINLDTGVITYTWTNGFDDTGTVVMTPQ